MSILIGLVARLVVLFICWIDAGWLLGFVLARL